MLKRTIRYILAKLPLFVIRDPAGTPYLYRYTLLKGPGFKVMLHRIVRSDGDRELHDHPWSFLTIMLRGGYYEETEAPNDITYSNGGPTRSAWKPPGTIAWHPAEHRHRVRLRKVWTGEFVNVDDAYGWHSEPVYAEREAWTLVIRGPRRREWGFWTDCGWQPWKQFVDKRYNGLPVCEEQDQQGGGE